MRFNRPGFSRLISHFFRVSDSAMTFGLPAFAALTLALMASKGVQAETPLNAQSPLGINLTSLSYSSTELPLLDNFKSNSGWITHSSSTWDTGEEQYLNLDTNGWPITLTAVNDPNAQQFTYVGVPLLNALPNMGNGSYPAGQYVVLYQGEGTITYQFDAVKNATLSVPGRDVINVATPSTAGIHLMITSTDPNHTGNYIRNIQVVKAEQEAMLKGGLIFNPKFLNLVQDFHVLRFMDWLSTNNSPLSSWANRPLQSNAFWGTKYGVPLETAVQLANAVSADAWLNVPHLADDNYITQMATLVHAQLGNNQKVYVEFSNEVWNGMFSQHNYAQAQAQAIFAAGLGSPFDYSLNWYGMRVAQMCDIWKSAWGSDANRVVCVMGAQAASTYTATEALNCPFWASGKPCASHGIGAVAIAPYFGGTVPLAWTSQPDGGLSSLFASLTSQSDPSVPAGGWLGGALSMVAPYPPALAPYKLPLIAYEGGQTFIGFPNGVLSNGSNSPLTNLYIAANRDPRMGTAYTTYLQGWKTNGGQLFMIFADIGTPGQYGEWGALESIMQPTIPLSNAPPKWQAIQNFISGNACWWPGCAGALTPTPLAPASVTAQ